LIHDEIAPVEIAMRASEWRGGTARRRKRPTRIKIDAVGDHRENVSIYRCSPRQQ
jgi:hypothetical protein